MSSLDLDADTFKMLMDDLIQSFFDFYKLEKNSALKDYQLFGFGSYDESSPSLKNYIHLKTGETINGKYLYNKLRECEKGHLKITLSGIYNVILPKAAGYKDMRHFIQEREPGSLHALVGDSDDSKEFHYIGYYCSEDFSVRKFQCRISDQWRYHESKFVYHEKGGDAIFLYHGNIEQEEGMLTFIFKLIINGKPVKKTTYVKVGIGNSTPQNRAFLKGVYAGFDLNNSLVCGKVILQKVQDEAALEQILHDPNISPLISNELGLSREMFRNQVPSDIMSLTEKSYEIKQLAFLQGTYELVTPKLILQIDSNFNAKLVDGQFSSLNGTVKILPSGLLCVSFFDANNDKRIEYIFQVPTAISKPLVGTFQGIDAQLKPYCGEAVFQRVK